MGLPAQHVPARRTPAPAVGELAATHGARVHVHACETAAELAAVRERHGRTPIEVLRDTGLLGPGTVLAHGVHLDDHDIELIAAAGATVTHCPASNQKLASGFARLPDLLAAGVPVALGTDGAASANDLDPWLAMRLAAYPQTAPPRRRGDHRRRRPGAWRRPAGPAPPAIPSIGSIEVGTRADLVVLDPSSPALTPSYDAVSTAVYAASRADVRWVVAGGRVVVDDRVLTTIDVDAAIAEGRRRCNRRIAAQRRLRPSRSPTPTTRDRSDGRHRPLGGRPGQRHDRLPLAGPPRQQLVRSAPS